MSCKLLIIRQRKMKIKIKIAIIISIIYHVCAKGFFAARNLTLVLPDTYKIYSTKKNLKDRDKGKSNDRKMRSNLCLQKDNQ